MLMSLMAKAKTQDEADEAYLNNLYEPYKGTPGQPDDLLEALHKHALDCPVFPSPSRPPPSHAMAARRS